MQKSVLIIGAGPAGLTAGYELIKKGYKVTIFEADKDFVGGISRTVEYKGFRFDIGGHRFFSKNKEVEKWWHDILEGDFLLRPRLSRWFYKGKFFQYPIKPFELLGVFGLLDSAKIMLSYLWAKLFPIKPELSLADWCINNFGRYLAKPFFIDYNLKLWGIDPRQLSKEFTLQRIKGISFIGTLKESLYKTLRIKGRTQAKSLIESFNYPKYGPGMLWEKVTACIREQGGDILMGHKVFKIVHSNGRLDKVFVKNSSGVTKEYIGDFLLSTMPLTELVLALSPEPEKQVVEAAKVLDFRDFITVALMVDKEVLPPDNWIYTHDKGMRSIRIQIFKNWSQYMVPDQTKSCIGFEYVCKDGDELWSKSRAELIELAQNELTILGFAKREEVFDAEVVRLRNVYPRYLIGFEKNVAIIKEYLQNTFPTNIIQPIGRGGLHRYNNSDHSMMTAFLAVKNILGEGHYDQWEVNSDAEYHEVEAK